MKTLVSLVIVIIVCFGAASAQDAVEVTPEVPFATVQPPEIITQLPDDARAGACSAFQRTNFVPYVVRPGDTLARLLADNPAMSVTQVAALNCIDDPGMLPVGSVIFLPFEAVEGQPMQQTSDPAAIIGFAASADEVTSTDRVTFTWTGTGDAAYFFACPADPAVECARPALAPRLPVEGSVTVGGFSYAGSLRYGLEIVGTGEPATDELTIGVTCAQEWLGGDGALPRCPEDPAIAVYGAWQPFERGVMMWFSDTGAITVMLDDGTFRVYADHYIEGQPDPAATAPEGLMTPVRGFGLLWEALGGADGSGLGWATDREYGIDSARQPAGRVSYTTYVQGPVNTVYALTELPDAEMGYWSQVSG